MLQTLLELGDTTRDQYVTVLSAWIKKSNGKLDTFNRLATPLMDKFSGDELRVLLHELAYFLNLIPFESVFEALRGYKQEGDYSRILANVLGDSLLDGGKRLEKFYKQFDTAIGAIGYSPKDLQAFEGLSENDMAGLLRDTTGELMFSAGSNSGKQTFAKRVWRAACTLHLTAIFQASFRVGKRWEEEFAPQFYQAIEVGSTEVFNSSYRVYDERGEYIGGHGMLVEVMKIGDKYRVKQFNSGNGIETNHKKWQGSTSSPVQRYLSSVDMPELSEEQIKNTGYYFVSGLDREDMIEKLYTNEHLAQNYLYTDPLLYERPQLAGTCAASSKMFYFRSFGLQGRSFEIDFKIRIIKQLLTRINNVMKSGLSRHLLLNLRRVLEDAILTRNDLEATRLYEEREETFKAVKIEGTDQLIFMFPQMFVSLISSALNEILESLYWIIKNYKLGLAEALFKHFLQETEPIFNSAGPYASELLMNVLPLIHDLHTRHFRGVELPSGILPKVLYEPRERLKGKDTIGHAMKQLRDSCLPPSKDKLPTCFYHIIEVMYLFPYAIGLAAITSELSEQLDFGDVSAELSYLLLDAMRSVYGEDFAKDGKSMNQVAFVSKLNWDYDVPKGTSMEDCEEFGHNESMENEIGQLARCTCLRKGPIKPMPLTKRIIFLLRALDSLTQENLATFFYHIIKMLRAYPAEAPEDLSSFTSDIDHFDFWETPPPLAYLLIDAIRSVYGGEYVDYTKRSQIAFLKHIPWYSYKGEEELLTDCEKVTDEHIIKNWRWVAACRFKQNGRVQV